MHLSPGSQADGAFVTKVTQATVVPASFWKLPVAPVASNGDLRPLALSDDETTAVKGPFSAHARATGVTPASPGRLTRKGAGVTSHNEEAAFRGTHEALGTRCAPLKAAWMAPKGLCLGAFWGVRRAAGVPP